MWLVLVITASSLSRDSLEVLWLGWLEKLSRKVDFYFPRGEGD